MTYEYHRFRSPKKTGLGDLLIAIGIGVIIYGIIFGILFVFT